MSFKATSQILTESTAQSSFQDLLRSRNRRDEEDLELIPWTCIRDDPRLGLSKTEETRVGKAEQSYLTSHRRWSVDWSKGEAEKQQEIVQLLLWQQRSC